MLDHTGFVVTDLKKARRFYDAIAEPLGLGPIDNGPELSFSAAVQMSQSPTCGSERPARPIGQKALAPE